MAQKKATIIKVSEDKVSIGMEDGSFFNVSRNELDFIPKVGDKVSVFSSGDMVIVSKVEMAAEKTIAQAPVDSPVQSPVTVNCDLASDYEENNNSDGYLTILKMLGVGGMISYGIWLVLLVASFYSDNDGIDLVKVSFAFLVIGIIFEILFRLLRPRND